MSSQFTLTYEALKLKDTRIAWDFVIHHLILESIWNTHVRTGNMLSHTGERIFIPVTLQVLPYYLWLYDWEEETFMKIDAILSRNIDYLYLKGRYWTELSRMLARFIWYYYKNFIFRFDEELSTEEVGSYIEHNQHTYFQDLGIAIVTDNYRQYRWKYIPTILSLKRFLRAIYDKWCMKIIREYLDSTFSVEKYEKYCKDNDIQFQTYRWYWLTTDSIYTSLSLYDDGTLLLNFPHFWCSRIKFKNGSRKYIFLRDILRAYPKSIWLDPKYSTAFWVSRTGKTNDGKRIALWINRLEKEILWKRYQDNITIFRYTSNTISLSEFEIL